VEWWKIFRSSGTVTGLQMDNWL